MNRPTRATPAGRAYLDLQNLARRTGKGTQELLTMYVVERWLARLSRSRYGNDFILKGGMLLASYGNRRPTVDADALARNMPADHDSVAARVADIAAITDADDGVEFLTDTITTATIRDDAHYAGVRVTMTARLETAQVKLRLDINFGDPVTPAPRTIELPALRPDTEPIRLLGYPIETVLAEKLATAIDLGPASTRVRDWADIYTLTGNDTLNYRLVRDALQATAAFRGTALLPLSTAAAGLVELRGATYTVYRVGLGRDGDHLPAKFSDVVSAVTAFADALTTTDNNGRDPTWDPVGRRWGHATP